MSALAPAWRRRRAHSRRHTRGMAVLGALLIIVIVVSIGATVGTRAMHAIAVTARVFEAAAANDRFSALEREGEMVLTADALKEHYDAPNEAWATTALTSVQADGRGDGHLRDLQGLFNLNDLAFEPAALAIAGGGSAGATDSGSANDNPDESADTNPDESADETGSAAEADAPPSATPASTLGARAGRPPAVAVPRGQGALGSAPSPAAGKPSAIDLAAGMLALASVPGVAGAGMPAVTSAPGQGVQLSPQQIALARFALLLRALEIDDTVLPAILDWLDPDTDTRFPNGAEDDYYTRLKPPYRSANRAFTDISELKLVRGVDAATYDKLRRFVTVLPGQTAINVNTAPVEILMSLAPAIDRTTADLIVHARTAQPFRAVAEFLALPLLVGRPVVAEGLATSTDYFALDMNVASGNSEWSARTLLSRQGGNDVAVLAREQGFFDE